MDVERLKGHPFVIRGKQIIQSEQDGKMLGMSLSLEEAAKSSITVSFAQFPGESGTSKVFQQTLNEMKRAKTNRCSCVYLGRNRDREGTRR